MSLRRAKGTGCPHTAGSSRHSSWNLSEHELILVPKMIAYKLICAASETGSRATMLMAAANSCMVCIMVAGEDSGRLVVVARLHNHGSPEATICRS